MTTKEPIKKGEQIYTFYGKRGNKVLMLWYGFCYSNNLYDSVPIRFKFFVDFQEALKDVSKFVFDNAVSPDPLTGVLKSDPNINIKNLTKEFKLKRSKLNLEMLEFLRVYLMQGTDPTQMDSVLIKTPYNLQYELKIMKFYEEIIKYLLEKAPTSIEEDEILLKDNPNYKLYFAVEPFLI